MFFYKQFIVSFLLNLAYSECYYCTAFSNVYVLYWLNSNSTCQEYYETDSISAAFCQRPIQLIGKCTRDSSTCKDKSYSNSPGTLQSSLIPKKSLCWWNFEFKKDSSTNFNFNSTGPAYLKILYTASSTYQNKSFEYKISEYSELSIKFPGNYFEVVLYTYSDRTGISVEIDWNSENTEKESESNLNFIVAVSCSSVLIVIVLALFCACLCKKRKIGRVASERNFQYVQPDSSYDSFVDTIIAPKYAERDLPDPCCICFEKYFVFSVVSGSFYRVLQCKHYFHSACIEDWIIEKKNSAFCPLCLVPLF